MAIVKPIYIYPMPYVFQEIKNVKTNSTYGYEALLRPENGISPSEYVNNRIMMGGTHQLEMDTFFNATKAFFDLKVPGYLFINSLPNEFFNVEESLLYEHKFGKENLSRVIVEIMQYPGLNKELWFAKQRFMLRHNMLSALDGFGTGINNDFNSIRFYMPEIVKISKELIHDFMESDQRVEYIKNLVYSLKEKDVKVLAEGIENVVEYEMLKEFGIDYAQGYYIGMPGIPDAPPFIPDGEFDSWNDK